MKDAEDSEKRYDWMNAAKAYGEALKRSQEAGDPFKAASFQEKVGHCLHRGAFQARTREEFSEKMHSAIQAYEAAVELYAALDDRSPWASRCAAIVSYLRHWLAVTPAEKNELMADWFKKQEQALEGFWSLGQRLEFGETYGLLPDAFDRFNDCRLSEEVWRSGLQKGLLLGEKALAALSELDAEGALARAYFSLSICLLRSMENIFEDTEMLRRSWEQVRRYLLNGFMLAERVCDAFVKGKISCELGYHAAPWEDRLKYKEVAVRCGEETHDVHLKTLATAGEMNERWYEATSLEEPDEISRLLEEYRLFINDLELLCSITLFYGHRTGGGVTYPPWGMVSYYGYRGSYEADLDRKREFFDKAIELGMRSLQAAKDYWGDLTVTGQLARALSRRAKLEPDPARRKAMLENALVFMTESRRLVPSRYWSQAQLCYEWGDVKTELANIAQDNASEVALLEEAMSSYARGLELDQLQERVEVRDYYPPMMAPRYPQHARLLTRLYSLTRNSRYLEKALEVLRKGLEISTQAGLVTRVAECHWELGKVLDDLNDFSKAAESFRLASDKYGEAGDKITMLKDFYKDYAVYMQAWSEIEEARECHSHMQYEEAARRFDEAAELVAGTDSWNQLSANYSAWARLEEAEALSRGEKTEEARDAFQLAGQRFAEAKSSVVNTLSETMTREEREDADVLVRASDLRREYCQARAVLEEARIFGGQGDLAASCKRYYAAAERFEKLVERTDQDSDRRELRPIASLCRAWSKMVQAEQKSSPSLYREASELFGQVVDYAVDQRTSALAQANGFMCKALEAGTGFEATKDPELFSAAKRYLDAATTQYLRAGFRTTSEYSRATSRLLDAYFYMYQAQVEVDPSKRAQSFQMAETMLQTSAGSFVKARLPAKAEEVQRVLEIVREDREIAVSLSRVLKAPTVASATTGFSAPAQTHETAVGLERFDESNILANLIPRQQEIELGQTASLEIELVNAGRTAAQLVKVEGIVPDGFEIVDKPAMYRVEDSYLDMKGKSLTPLKTEEVKLLLRPVAKGTHQLKPRILYLDNSGRYKSYEPEPATIAVKELGISGWIRGPRPAGAAK